VLKSNCNLKKVNAILHLFSEIFSRFLRDKNKKITTPDLRQYGAQFNSGKKPVLSNKVSIQI